jgi:branched-chain amino acid transport system permease protein
VAIGAYVSSILTLNPLGKSALTGLPSGLQSVQLDLLPAALIAMGVAGAVALVVGLPILRLNGPSAVIAIFALLLIVNVVLNGWTGVTQGAGGLYAVPRDTTIGVALAFGVVAVVLARLLRDSSLGLQLRATREDALSAASVGVRVLRARMVAWVVSAMVCAAGGVLFAHLLTAFTPSAFYFSQTFLIIVMLVVGGMNTVGGAVLGAILVTLVQEGLRPLENGGLSAGPIQIERLTGLTQVAYVLMILAVMYYRKDGLLGQDELDVRIARWCARPRRSGRRMRGAER